MPSYGVCEIIGFTAQRIPIYEFRSYGYTYWMIGEVKYSTKPLIHSRS